MVNNIKMIMKIFEVNIIIRTQLVYLFKRKKAIVIKN